MGRYYVHRLFTFQFPDVSSETVTIAADYLRAGFEATLAKYPVLTGYLGPASDTTRKNVVQVLYNDKQSMGSHINDTNFVIQVVKQSEEKDLTVVPSFDELIQAGIPSEGLPATFCCAIPDVNPTKDWVPVFTLKATFLEEGKALVLGFIFQHSIVDRTTMATVFDTFVKNLKLAPAGNDAGKLSAT